MAIEPDQVEDNLNCDFTAKWLSTFGLKSPTSLEAQMALEQIARDFQLLGSKAPAKKIEAGFS